MSTIALSVPSKKEYLPEEFKLTVWSRLKPYYHELLNRKIYSAEDLERWLLDRSELDAAVEETFAWRYIKITIDSRDEKALELYHYAVQQLSPKIASYANNLNKKLIESPFLNQLDQEKYFTHIRGIRNAVQLFQEKSIPLTTAVQLQSKQYGKIFSEMTIGVNGKQMTLQQAGTLLEEPDRNYRESIYHKINRRILQDTKFLEDLFDELLKKRHQIALNAGYQNFRDYKFQALGRFDYKIEDCIDFHDSIAHEILPILDNMNTYREKMLGLEKLRPWDLHVDTSGQEPLRPFENTGELIGKAISCLSEVHPYFGEAITIMQKMGHLDLDSRTGKAPGGYNMPLNQTGVPFIFMNATHSMNDMRTLMHESGHAVHSLLTRNYRINSVKRVPSEVAELAAMTMELLSMDYWSVFYPNQADLKRAKIMQLETVLKVLPWIATIDKFQHWLYTNPDHTRTERKDNWMKILKEFSSNVIDHEGLEAYSEYLWHKQLHLFEVPFYYIEYGMAQLGAIAIWKNFRENPELAIDNYIQALKLGYTKPIREIYQTAGISFDFSREYVSELGTFVKNELQKLLQE